MDKKSAEPIRQAQAEHEYISLRSDAEEWVTEAAKILALYQDKASVVQMKDTVDLSTTADIASERFLIDAIQKKYPTHAIYSEESGNLAGNSEYVWVIDPLDGTKEYARGLREYNCLLALERNGELVVGAMYRNGVTDLMSAARGFGVSVNGKPIHVSKQEDMTKAFIGFHIPVQNNPVELIDMEMRVMTALIKTAYRVRPDWNDAKGCSWVARGVIDAYILSANVNQWYDIATGILLVEEAGGKVTDWYGFPVTDRNLSKGIVLSNGLLHDQILGVIQEHILSPGKERGGK